jgi:hypothetical protein
MRKVFYLILTGIAFGILVVPGRGSETWQKIAEFLDDLKSKTKNTINDLIGGTKNMAEEEKATVEKSAKEW